MAKDPTQKAKLTLQALDLTLTKDVTNDYYLHPRPDRFAIRWNEGRRAARLLLAACLLVLAAACTRDDGPAPTDGPDAAGTPIIFTALRPAPMTDANTRAVPGKDEWKGDGTEKIGVAIYDENKKEIATGIYTITDKNGSVTSDQPIFWPDKTGKYYIAACYPLPGNYSINDQSTSEKLTEADLLQSPLRGEVTPDSRPVALQFRHIMAKIRVELTGVAPDARDIKVEVQHKFSIIGLMHVDYTAINYNNIPFTACRDASTPEKVAFEVLVPDGSAPKDDFICITIGDKTYFFTPEGDQNGKVNFPSPGAIYTYRIDIPSAPATAAAARLTLPAPSVTPFNTSER